MADNRLERFCKLNDEVLCATQAIVQVDGQDIDELVARSRENARQRIRICAHRNAADAVHDMFIVHPRGAYVHPHKHPGKSESFHVVAGAVDVVLFDDEGRVLKIIPLGDYRSGRSFFYRLSAPFYHTLRIHSEVVVFHEVTNGPFNRADTVFAPWAPFESEVEAVRAYLQRLADFVGPGACEAASL
jgi:cupin fold WbuC family metalloprotein